MVLGKFFFRFILAESLLLFILLLHGALSSHTDLNGKKEIVQTLGLTDFAIWTEARYTRHPSQTDFFSAFQDLPGSLDHFPAGSIIAPNIPSSQEAVK